MSIKVVELKKLGISGSKRKSEMVAKMREKNILISTKENGRIYTISFANNYLLKTVIGILHQKGFVDGFLEKIIKSLSKNDKANKY